MDGCYFMCPTRFTVTLHLLKMESKAVYKMESVRQNTVWKGSTLYALQSSLGQGTS